MQNSIPWVKSFKWCLARICPIKANSEIVNVIGIDFSKEAIHIASIKSRGAFICGSAQTLPFPDSSFDFVVAKDVLEHVPDDNMVLDEIRRVCKDDAILILYLPCNLKGWNFSTEAFVQTLIGYTIDEGVGYLRRYTPQQTKYQNPYTLK